MQVAKGTVVALATLAAKDTPDHWGILVVKDILVVRDTQVVKAT
jgi:hypothetical protein